MTSSSVDIAIPRSEAHRPDRLSWARLANSKLLDLLAATAAVLLVAAPMLFTKSGFALDFTNHLWLAWVAGKALFQSGHPTYFVNTSYTGVFYPHFAFYGGTLYALTGGLGELLGGHPILAYLIVTTLAIAGSYGGMLWLGRQLGLSRWLSHAPALVVVTSAYYISDLYGRGAWTEFMATSAIAPLLASALCLIRAERWRPWPVVVFVASTVVFTGSHNITLLWGTTMIAFALAILWVALGRPKKLPLRRIAAVAGFGVVVLLVSAWYLIPDTSYAGDTKAHLETALGHEGYSVYRAYIKPILAFDPPGVLLDPLRHVPRESTVPALYVQIPDWFLVWALAAGWLLLWRPVAAARSQAADRGGSRHRGRARDRAAARSATTRQAAREPATAALTPERRWTLRRAWIGAAVLLAAVLLMIMYTPFWSSVPFPFDAIQFPFRLGTYAYYAVSALVLVSVLGMQLASGHPRLAQRTKRLRAALIAVGAISVGLCIWQEWVPNTLYHKLSYTQREKALASVNTVPRSWYDTASFNDVHAPEVAVSPNRVILFDPRSIHNDRYSGWVKAPPGMAPIQTNIAAGPYLVHASGLTPVGRNEAGFEVVRRSKNGNGPVHVVLETAHSGTIVFGWVLSGLASLIVIAVLAWTVWRSGRRRVSPAEQQSR